MAISLFLNTRKRTSLLDNLLSSLYTTAYDPNSIEVFITVDNDDDETKKFLDKYKDNNINIRSIERPSNLHVSINEMASMATGDFLFVLNDDVIFRTYHWDKKIIESYDPNEILYISTNDNSIDKTKSRRYASFPILTRGAYEALGFFMSEKFVSHGGDVHLWRIFDSLGLVRHSQVFLDHVLHKDSQSIEYMRQEETAQEAIKMTFETFVDCWDEDISDEITRVSNRINNKA
tara:strand:- start:710 stop:1408 length:699 start_codon:yes stop_codon:yes gene_type:complete